jgi:hypothetical protein
MKNALISILLNRIIVVTNIISIQCFTRTVFLVAKMLKQNLIP